MCTGKCSSCIGSTLYPLAVISIICNIILFFPGWDVTYAKDGHITEEVKYMGGIVGGGIMVLIPALHIHLVGSQGCCANRCGMFLSIAFAAVGVAGALYSFIVAILGLINGPLCKVILIWGTPFKDRDMDYLSHSNQWQICTEPKNVVEFNIGLFSTLLATSSLQIVLCAIQMVNGLFGCLCGTCKDKGLEKKAGTQECNPLYSPEVDIVDKRTGGMVMR
ncbi:transmembrane 4 L6 family member 4 [Aplochiton taeniatus]